METRAHYVLIGAFVMIAIAAAFLFVLWIGSAQREYDTYDVIFNERVTGLSTGSIVRFNGIQKGEVEDLRIDPTDPSIVIARVRVDKDAPIKTDTKVELEPVGFTGLAIIQFVGGSAEAPLLKEASDKNIPEIVADTGTFAQFLAGSGEIVSRANQILSDENIQNFSRTLADIQTVTGAVAENREEISELIQNANAATAELNRALENLRRASDGLEDVLAEDAPQAVRNADALITDTRDMIAEVEAMIAENRESIQYFADQGLGQVAPALAEARQLMRSLDYVLREIERDPKAFFLGDVAPEYEAESE